MQLVSLFFVAIAALAVSMTESSSLAMEAAHCEATTEDSVSVQTGYDSGKKKFSTGSTSSSYYFEFSCAQGETFSLYVKPTSGNWKKKPTFGANVFQEYNGGLLSVGECPAASMKKGGTKFSFDIPADGQFVVKIAGDFVGQYALSIVSRCTAKHESSKDPRVIALQEHFAGSWSTTQTVEWVKGLEYEASETLFASSVCSDEINYEHGDLSPRLQELFGESFNIGGLGGCPFPGVSGFGAFAHHVPAEGRLFILAASHVGIALDGTVGYYNRIGQEHASTSCGAGIGSYNALLNAGESKWNRDSWTISEFDGQIDTIKKELSVHMHDIVYDINGDKRNADDVNTLIPAKGFEVISLFVDQIKTNFENGAYEASELVILGGVIINVSNGEGLSEIEDQFLPLNFEVIEK